MPQQSQEQVGFVPACVPKKAKEVLVVPVPGGPQLAIVPITNIHWQGCTGETKICTTHITEGGAPVQFVMLTMH